MSLLGAPLEQDEIDSIRSKFPDFAGEVPDEAKFWSESDLELFFNSNGQLRPRETSKMSMPSCALLTRLRQKIAEMKAYDGTTEYRSWCKSLAEKAGNLPRPAVAECMDVRRSTTAPSTLKKPVVLEHPGDKKVSHWTMDFWKKECPKGWWSFRSRSPAFEHDTKEADKLVVEGFVSEYVDYARIIQKMDPQCQIEDSIAYPRVSFESWCPFAQDSRSLFETCWKELQVPGLQDLTLRWVKLFTSAFNMDWLEYFGRYFRINMAATGSISRLRCENHGAHIWFMQIEGKTAFFLFSPQEAKKGLYPESGEELKCPEGYTASASSVDIFHPNAKRHSNFAETKAEVVVLAPKETLIIPAGWWRCSVALEPSVTLSHAFWNMDNKRFIVNDFREQFNYDKMPPELTAIAARTFQDIHANIMDDDDSDLSS